MSKELPKELQIEILRECIDTIKKLQTGEVKYTFGICHILIEKINLKTDAELISASSVREYIPLAIYKNAAKHANANKPKGVLYWWSDNPYDCENRLKFLQWIIDELKKK